MSVTFDIGCLTCREKLWVGQGDYLYDSPAHLRRLASFMLSHAGHHLIVATEQMSDLEDCREIHDNRGPES